MGHKRKSHRRLWTGQNAPAFLDQRAVGLDQRLVAAFEIEHGNKLSFESLAAVGVGGARIEVFAPVLLAFAAASHASGITYVYDALGRVTGLTYDNGTQIT
jgi:hypothetical protein